MTERFEISPWRRGAERSFPHSFERQARRNGEAVALLVGERTIRRAELERRANRLAHHLRRLGAGPESRVGLLLERSDELVVALLAVLKAGAAYLPLDPSLPRQRLAAMLSDAGARHLLTENGTYDLPRRSSLQRIDVDGTDILENPDIPPIPRHHAESLAYLIYTSGSTGRPKGVEVSRGALDNFLDSMASRPGMTSCDTVLALTTVGFDIAILELLLPLAVGARIVLVDRDVASDPIQLAHVLEISGATLMQATPATWRLLVGSGWRGHPGLKALCGGEALPADLAADLLGRTAELWNLYGPTETTVWSSLSRIDTPARRGTAPLGEPIDRTRIHLLGKGLTPTAPGEPGEILIGGDGLARAYCSQPALTAERFVPDPFGPPGSRLYRTGDLGRRCGSGILELAGRIDDQLKLRGFRIEPAEVEGALRRHPEVVEAVVVAHRNATDSGDARLVAYLVGPRPSAELAAELRRDLAETLPDYMVPAVFVGLEKLPLTPSGKVDRNALARRPLPGSGRQVLRPRTEVEEAVLATWSEVLGRSDLGVEDDFFALGGHSLLAVQVVSRLRRRFGAELSPRSLFDHPTPRRLAAAVDHAAKSRDAPLGPRHPKGRPLPLSFAQQRLWFLEQLAPESAAYNLAERLHLEGELDPAALDAALDALVARHETLRTTFPAQDGRPEQHVAPRGSFPRILVDLTGLPEGSRRQVARQLARREAERPFDLGRGPLVRAVLLRLRHDEHFFDLALHHIIADGWSLGVLYRELDQLYDACRAGRASPLPRLPVQYGDFTLWQSAAFDAARLAKEIAYWREQLDGAPAVLELPADRPRDRALRGRRGRQSKTLDAGLRSALEEVGRSAGTSLFMTLLAIWMTLLHRLCGLRDVLVGSPVAGRHRPETEGLIGFFVNTLVLRGDLRGDPSFRELLQRVRETALQAYSHQELPFERLVEELRPERQLDRNPFFQVMFDLQNVPEHLGLATLRVRRSELLPGGAELEPSLSIREEGTSLVALVEYDATLFDATTVHRLLAHLEILALDAATSPERRLQEIGFFSPAGTHQILTEWNDTQRRPAGQTGEEPSTFLTLFGAQVRERPQAPALIDVASGRQLTYQELDDLASQAGRALRRRGVGPECRVGVSIGRSVELVAAFIGVLRAGGAYVPLDPGYPEERLALMIEDSEIEHLLTDEVARTDLFSSTSELREEDERFSAANPESAAYVIYTSGSTGEPKGVVVSHGALAWYCLASGRHYGLGAGERVLQFASISFDISVGEIFPTLAMGAALVLRDDEMAGSIDAHLRRCREHQVSVLLPPTAFWHELAAEVERRGDVLAPSLRLVSFGGEQVIGERIDAWRRRLGERIELWNGYGPTEASVEAAIQPLKGFLPRGAARIGRPVDGVQVLVLDPVLRLTPVGAAGELSIASPGLARGYHRRAAVTARRFVPNPHARRPGERLYRTGDLARELADGTLELLGRTDRQVKIRGFRVELGEVEALLARHDAVDEAVVQVRDGRLVAFLVSAAAPSAEDLRSFLRRSLPAYMVPASFVALEALPLSPAGKIDRDALPDPEEAIAGASYAAPRSELEIEIASIWGEVLSRDGISADDDFFELGGHSLLATQVTSRLRRALGVEVPVRLLFERTTLAGLATEILRRIDDGDAARLSQPPLAAAPRRRGPLSFAQQRLYFLDRLEETSTAYLMADAFRLTGPLDTGALLGALAEIPRRHEGLAARFQEEDGEAGQVPLPGGAARTAVVDLTSLDAARRADLAHRLVDDEAARPIDLARGPAIRTMLLRLGEREHVLLRTIHHIASDGWSDGIFYRELEALYRAARHRAGRWAASPLPEPVLQYADFALWQRRWLEGEILDRQLAYWKEALAGAPTRLRLATDRPRSARPRHRGAIERRHLDKELRTALEELGREHKASLFMTLLAGWTLLLERYTGQDDLVVGSPIANRTRPELEALIGCFVNSLPLRVRTDAQRSFTGHLRHVREIALGAFAHQDLPFERLVEELGPERHLDTNPIFQVMFDHQLSEKATIELEEVRAESVAATSFTVAFEPSLTVWNDGGELVAGIEHDAELHDAATISRMLAHYESLLRSALGDPRRRTGELAFATPAEERQVLARRWQEAPRPEASDEDPAPGDEAAERRIADTLARIWADVLGLPHVAAEESFFTLGGDSILSLRVLARARPAGLHLQPRDLFRHQTVAALARHLAASRDVTAKAATAPESGGVPLTPIQRSFFAWQLPEPWHYNQSVLLVLRRRLEVPLLAAAARPLAEHHAALRLRFERSGGIWRQLLLDEAGEPPVARLDLSRLQPDKLEEALERAKAQVQASLDLTSGPIWRLVLLDAGAENPERLLAVVHHLAVDAVSWGVLLDDLEHLYSAYEKGSPPELPSATTAFPDWARRLDTEALGPGELERYSRLVRQTVPLPVDHEGANTLGSEATVVTRLDAAETDLLLRRANAAYRTRPEELLLTALARVLARWSGGDTVVELEAHGRDALGEDVDLSRSVGWFTVTYPVALRVRGKDVGSDLKAVKETLRQVPSGRRRRLVPQVSFNYLGHVAEARLDGSRLFAAHEASGPEQSRRGMRTHLLDLNGGVAGGRFELEWAYSRNVHEPSTVEGLAAGLRDELRRLVQHCLSPGAGGVTPSDFPLAVVDPAALERLLQPFARATDLEDVYPLTPLQEGMLFHSRLAPRSGVYFEQLSWILQDVERTALRRAWQTVVDRHAVLRTSFVWEGLERPLQRVHRQVTLPFEELDFRHLGRDEQTANVERLLEDDRRRGFALDEAPLTRILLVRLGDGERGETCRLVWSCHHLLLDGWSTPTVLDEAAKAYDALCRGEEPRLPPPQPFRDYLAWLAEQKANGEAEAFYRLTLAGFEAPTPLPPPPPGSLEIDEDAAPGEIVLALSPGVTATLEATARRRALTLNTVVQGAWARVLAAISGEDDVVFGATVAGRPAELAGAESIVGLLANTLPVRIRLGERRETAGEYLRRLQDGLAEMCRFEATPLVDVRRWSGVAAGESLFHTVLVFENFPLREGYENADFAELKSFSKTSYPMTLYALPGHRLTFELSYDRRRVGAALARRSLHHLETVLTALADGFGQEAAELSVLSAAERHQLSVEWAPGPSTTPPVRSALQLFEAEARRKAGSVALVFRPADALAEELTYGELDRRAEELARRLRDVGVGPEALVGVAVERSVEMVVALLAVWKAGGAYVPLDPSYPAERLELIMDDAGLAALVAKKGWLADRRPRASTPPLPGDESPGYSLDNLAYVLYTSGSTGQPKGVEVTHRTLVQLLAAMARRPGLHRRDVVLAVTTISFDIAALELWLPLTRGARVVLVDRATASDGERLREALADTGATLLQGTPATWRLLLDAGWPGGDGLKALCGGEEMPRGLAQELHRRSPEAWNLYGPTEATVWSLVHRVDATPGAVPIGRPVDATRVHVLGPRMEAVAIAAPGEVHLGGGGLARGYRRRPAVTAERFVPNPFADRGARLYRTGDLARWRHDATLEFLGRRDHQVKVRGFRIELGEVEAALIAVEGVREAAVLVQGEGSERRLVAHLVADTARDPGELRAALLEKLPAHMVPAAFTAVDEMPRSPTGKVDRRALARRSVEALAEAVTPPATPTEEILAGIWSRVLERRRISVDESFFVLGGHSLNALQVVSRIRTDLGRELALRVFFDGPTIRELARHLETAPPLAAAPPILPAPPGGDLPLSFAQERMWLLEGLDLASGTRYHVHSALALQGPLDVAALAAALRGVVQRHEVLRSRFPSQAGEPCLRIAPSGDAALPIVDLSALPAERRQPTAGKLCRREAHRSFGLADGPLLRAVLFVLGPGRHVFSRTVHHIVFDGYSETIFHHELGELYRAARHRRPSPLAPLPIAYADFARWQRRHLGGETLRRELDWWRHHLDGLPPALHLPADRPRPAERRPRPALYARQLPASLSQGLERLRLEAGTTFFMTSLAAFAALAGRYAGTNDVVLGSPVANRNRRETEGLAGLFVNTVLLRVDLGGDPTVRELLHRVREVALDVHAHQDLPFERLVQELAPHRRPGENPLFEVMFLEDDGDDVPELEELEAMPFDEDEGTALFELTLSVSRSADGVTGTADYDAGLFDETSVRRLLSGYENLLRGFVEAPDRRIGELDLLGTAERHQLLREWNDTAADWGEEALTVPRLFAEQAARTGEADAIVFAGRTWSYRELHERTLQLAGFLRGLGVGPEKRVGLLGERSPEMVVALLATLAAGGTAVPVDPAHPRMRLAWTIDDARLSLLLTQEKLRPLVDELGPLPALCLDADWPVIERRGAPAPPADVDPDAAAYLIYTSGSTGRPKAAVNTHRGLANHLLWMRRDYPLSTLDRVAQKTPASFDVAIWETLWPLLCGAALVVAKPGGHLDSAYLAHLVAREKVTVLHHVPSTLPLWLEEDEAERSASLRWVICGGEALPGGHAERFAERFAEATTLHNFYGPAEASIGVTARACERRPETAVLALGRPGANTDLHLLDDELRPVPIGAAGELFVGAAPPGRGYWNGPRPTAERFLPDPWSGRRGARLYRTGDLARRGADGTIHFLGRTDHQVKLRGQRIEPGEVEAELARHPAVRQAAVVVRELTSADQGLVAFVVAREARRETGSAEWRRFLNERLPAAMVPAAFVTIDALPSTPAGKVDRGELVRRPLPTAERQATCPTGPTERRLAAVYAEVLGLESVEGDGEFFALGGHSLLAVRLLARIEERLGVALALSELFHEPTLRRLAARIDGQPGPRPSLVVELAAGEPTPLFCVHPVGGHVLGYRELVAHLPPELSVYALQSVGHEDGKPFLGDVEAMARAYLAAVREVSLQGPYLLGGWSMGGWIAFEMARQLRDDGGEAALVVLIDSAVPGENGSSTSSLAAFAEELGIPAELCDPAWEALPPEEGLRRLHDRARTNELLENGIGPKRLGHLYRLFRNNLEAIDRYVPGFYDGRITLLLSADWTEEELASWHDVAADVEISRVPGDHRSMMREPHVRVLAERLSASLARSAPKA